MKSKTSFGDPIRLIRFAAVLWIVYLAILAIISQSVGDPRRANTETFFYILLALVAFICLGLAYWSWVQEQLGQAFLPIMISLITVLPILTTWIIFKYSPPTPMLDPQSSILRLLPFLLVGFLLVAWRYSWPFMLLVILGITGLNIAIILSFSVPDNLLGAPPFRGFLTIPLIQMVIFLAVGFSISYLMNRIRKQQQSLEDANINLTHYASTLEHLTTSRERNRLARELHDTLAHTLSGLSVQLETIKAYWDVDQNMARSSLEKSIDVAHSGLEETRRALKALRASPLDDLGLTLAIKALAKEAAARGNLELDLSKSGEIPALPPDVEHSIYRIAQEAITNVGNHAMAKILTIEFEYIEGKVYLVVHDDGIGFDIEKSNKSRHFGLTGMQERAGLIGGELRVISNPGSGTTVHLTV